MDRLSKIQQYTETLQREVIGEPKWVQERSTFEYTEVTIKVVAILKLIRAVQSLKSIDILCRHGLFIDMGSIYRCLADCIAEIYFLLEKYPEKSNNVSKFIENFSQTSIDQYLCNNTEHVKSKKIHSAMARVLSGSTNDHQTLKTIRQIYETFSGYIHTNYAHIMQIYGGSTDYLSFNLGGVTSERQKLQHYVLYKQTVMAVLHLIAFMANVFDQRDLYSEIRQEIQ